jgi:hypothetical protein
VAVGQVGKTAGRRSGAEVGENRQGHVFFIGSGAKVPCQGLAGQVDQLAIVVLPQRLSRPAIAFLEKVQPGGNRRRGHQPGTFKGKETPPS